MVILKPDNREQSGNSRQLRNHTPMNTKMYVGNLSFDATETDLRELFGQYGQVNEVFMPTDRDSGRPRGFAFVTLESVEAMNQAITNLNGNHFLGRNLTVNEARPRDDQPRQGRSFSGGGGGRSRRY